jgi:hypothetical protein
VVQYSVPKRHTNTPPSGDEPRVFKSSRLVTLLVVLGLHLGVIAWLVLGSDSSTVGGVAADAPLELVFLPPIKFPQALADIAHPKHVNVNVGISLVPPSLDSDSSSPPAPVSQNGGGGAGVNWTAEARRAVKAFEIRRDEHVIHSALGTSAWDGWPSPGEHHAGDKYRTESGDWVVWIDSNCYQIASWREGAPVRDETPPQTICVNAGSAPPTIVLDARGAGRR